jgi:hypothetical protein
MAADVKAIWQQPSKLVGWMALLAGGAAGAWWVLRRRLSGAGPKPEHAAALLRAIVGNDKQSIAAIFGPPRASAGFAALAPALLVRSDYLLADTWYYPLDIRRHTALVVRFDSDVASHAEVVQIPLL